MKRFDRAKTRLEEVTAEIQEKQTASANMGTFLNAFEQMPDALAEFSLESWYRMVDFATVYSIKDIRFTFKNGQLGLIDVIVVMDKKKFMVKFKSEMEVPVEL